MIAAFSDSKPTPERYSSPGRRREGEDTDDRQVLSWRPSAWSCLLALGHTRRGHRQPVCHTARPDADCRRCTCLACGAGIRCAHPLERGAARRRLAQRWPARGEPRCRQSRAFGHPRLGGGAQHPLVMTASDPSAPPLARQPPSEAHAPLVVDCLRPPKPGPSMGGRCTRACGRRSSDQSGEARPQALYRDAASSSRGQGWEPSV